MATWYVNDDGDGSAGTSWATADTSLANSITNRGGSMSNGDVIKVQWDHYKVYTATTTITLPKSLTIVSVDKDNSDAYRAGAKEGNDTGGLYVESDDSTSVHVSGITFSGQEGGTAIRVGASTTGYGSTIVFRDCGFYPNSGQAVTVGNVLNSASAKFINCVFDADSGSPTGLLRFQQFGHVKSCTFANIGASCRLVSRVIGRAIIEDCDLSAIYSLAYLTYEVENLIVRRCRLKSGVNILEGSSNQQGSYATIEYCGTAEITATPLPLYKQVAYGGTTESTAAVYRDSAGNDGENSYSYKLTANANCSSLFPLELSHTLAIRHNASASKTLTIYMGSDDSGLYDNEVWAEVSFGDESATTYTTGTFVTTRPNFGAELAAGSSTYLKTDSATWTGSGPSTKYKLEITGVDPEEPCWVTVRIFFAAASQNLWVCPKIELT